MQLEDIKGKIDSLPLDQQVEILDLLRELEEVEGKKIAKDDFMAFVKMMWPSFINGRHH